MSKGKNPESAMLNAGRSVHTVSESFRAAENSTDVAASSENTACNLKFESILPSSTQPEASSSRPPKRPREEAEEPESTSSSDPNDDPSSSSESSTLDSSSSPPKRQKREKLNSALERAKITKKKVRFHPATVDNSLWADLYPAKYVSEIRNSEAEALSVLDEMDDAESERSQLSSSAETVVTSESVRPLRAFKSRREISCHRAASFLAGGSWHNSFQVCDRTSEDESDPDDDTLSSHLEKDDSWPEDELEDVSVPRSSPPPSVRIMATDLSAEDTNSYQASMEDRRQKDAELKLPSRYMRPLRSMLGTRDGRQLIMPIVGETKRRRTNIVPSLDEVSNSAEVLLKTMNKLGAEDTQAVAIALEVITRYHAILNFQAGLHARQVTKQQQKDSVPAS